jgi:alginate O-acetyltransferase complex protein AlgI
MTFNSLSFLIFFAVVVPVHFMCPRRFRVHWLLAVSYFFYATWRPEYLALLAFSTVIDYVAGRAMGAQDGPTPRRKAWMVASVVVNLTILCSFKFLGYLSQWMRDLTGLTGMSASLPELDVLLPIGVSFYTFQSMSYTIDVYRGDRAPEKSLARFALYVSFFPQLVAGPVERSTTLLPQFSRLPDFNLDRLVSGLRLMGWGFFKKVVLADRMAVYVDLVYASPEQQDTARFVMAAYLFTFQLYLDFSAYTDIARGAARCFGLSLMENFHRPYLATSMKNQWERWHISLSSWFRDYLYKPLGGGRHKGSRNVIIVFGLSGLWHAATLGMFIWGLLQAAALIFERQTRDVREQFWARVSMPRLRHVVAVFLVFHFWTLSLVFFRSTDVPAVWKLLTFQHDPALVLPRSIIAPYGVVEATTLILGLVLVFVVEQLHARRAMGARVASWPWWLRWLVYDVLIVILLLFYSRSPQQFVYFQF